MNNNISAKDMITTKQKKPLMVQMVDRTVVREYEKDHSGFLWSSTEVVRTEKISDEVVLRMNADRLPDKIYFNNKEYKLFEVVK